MFLVVAFSSSLDVAAIEMELGAPLDYNHELKTVGISNAISGILGGEPLAPSFPSILPYNPTLPVLPSARLYRLLYLLPDDL